MTSAPDVPDTMAGVPSGRIGRWPDAALILALVLGLPVLVYYLWFCLVFNHGQPAWPSAAMLDHFPLPTAASVTIVTGWLAFQGLLQIYAPGRRVEGPPMADGTRLKYRLNGWSAWWLTWAVLGGGVALGLFSPAVLADQFGALLSTANGLGFVLAFYLYWHGRRHRAERAAVKNSPVHDFWLGTALNPRIAGFDLKFFCEARPGLIAWIVLDLTLAAKQYELHGFVSLPMILVCAFQVWYVTDYFLHEEAILTTWDIRHEKFGFMLCWGDLVWVPFTYTIQAYYLVEHAHDLPWWGVLGIVLLNTLGYAIFRGTNLQKHNFRKNPATPIWGKPARYIRTAYGPPLLTSGWWGLSRHMNYFGDLLMGIAWCLPCLFGSPLPYFYVVYFTILLVQRERRDHRLCAVRYGRDWDTYCKQVRYRIVPGVY